MRLLQDLITQHAHRSPEATAVVCGEDRLTYLELDAQSTKLARLLGEAGCRQGDRVAVLMPKSTMAIVAMLGIYKADAVYVPLDPASPTARLSKILESCGCRWVLAGNGVAPILADLLERPRWGEQLSIGWLDRLPLSGISVEFTLGDLSVYPSERRAYQHSATKPAHILFTSGSTGVPKGVVISHANVLQCVDWAVTYFSITSSDRLACHSQLHFNMSFLDIFSAAAAGAELHLVPPAISAMPTRLAEFIRESAITQWFSVPAVLNYMTQLGLVGDFPSLKRVLWAGDSLPTPTLRQWMTRLPHAQFTNLYGPTETTIVSSYYTVPACPSHPRASIPIGSACNGEELLVLDPSLRPVPPGEVGEICIGGAGVSLGYWRDAAQTDAVFVADPRRPGRRLYRTGDLGKQDHEGLTYLLGRRDSQIKSRGYRIELGEIEAALHTIDALRESAVVAVRRGGIEGSVICCAYATAPAAEPPSPRRLRSELGQLIPPYMMPQHWLSFPSLPLNTNGKVDRHGLTRAFGEWLDRYAAPAARPA